MNYLENNLRKYVFLQAILDIFHFKYFLELSLLKVNLNITEPTNHIDVSIQ